jgi:hypothetical protein
MAVSKQKDGPTSSVPQPDAWTISMVDYLGDEQLVDLALAFARGENFDRGLSPKERQEFKSIRAELLYRLRNSRRVRITTHD